MVSIVIARSTKHCAKKYATLAPAPMPCVTKGSRKATGAAHASQAYQKKAEKFVGHTKYIDIVLGHGQAQRQQENLEVPNAHDYRWKQIPRLFRELILSFIIRLQAFIEPWYKLNAKQAKNKALAGVGRFCR